MATAVICEFNPFHNGHKYLLETAKRYVNEPIIAIMSGSFTQRGEVAITDKFSRTQAALCGGADLVVELPSVYAVANAQRFAECGVKIAASFDCVNHLAFGCENDNTENLLLAAECVKNPDVILKLKEKMKEGEYYPRALEAAVRQVLGEKVAEVLTTPNNILAVEYIRALENTKIKPLAIKRTGVSHDSSAPNGNIASASHIRELARSGENVSDYLPQIPEDITFPENLERAILYVLRSMTADDFAQLPDVKEGLENRIVEAVKNCNTVNDIISDIKTKRYTHARLRRILICALLKITEDLQTTPVEYVRVLGFSKAGGDLLKTCRFEVITSPSKGLELGENIKKLLKKDILATDIAALAYKEPKSKSIDFKSQIVKI